MHCHHVTPRLLVYASIQKRPGRLAAESFGSFTPAFPERAPRPLKRESWQPWNFVELILFLIYRHRLLSQIVSLVLLMSQYNPDNQLMCIHRSWFHLACNLQKGPKLDDDWEGRFLIVCTAMPMPMLRCTYDPTQMAASAYMATPYITTLKFPESLSGARNASESCVLYLLGAMAVASKSSWKWPILPCSALPMQPPARTRTTRAQSKSRLYTCIYYIYIYILYIHTIQSAWACMTVPIALPNTTFALKKPEVNVLQRPESHVDPLML